MFNEKIYKTLIIPINCSKKNLDYLFQCNRLSAQVWNLCIELNNKYKEQNNKNISMGELQKLTKQCVPLHAKGIHHVVHKYLYARDAMFRSIKAKHENSNKVKLPYKTKKFFVTGWDYQSIKIDYNKGIIYLSKPYLKVENKNKFQKPVKCYAKTIPKNIVEIEIVYKDRLCLAIKYKEENQFKQIKSNNIASIDLGEIHSITSIDNNQNAIIITGRKIRAIKQLRNKHQAKIYERMSKCTKGSKQYKKYRKALNRLKHETERKINDSIHKTTKLYLDYCLQNNISVVYYGDLDSATRLTKENHKGSNITRQKLSQWSYGQIILQLENKLTRYGIKMIKIKEYYTSKKCPKCNTLNEIKNRKYQCNCGYKQHRDIVGAINILNDNAKLNIKKYNNLKYLQIA